jgi:hypothetical protein
LFDQHGVSLGHEELLALVHDVGGAVEERRRAEATWSAEQSPPRWPTAKVDPKCVYVSVDGIMYCTNQSEPHPQDPNRSRLIWQQMKVGCVYWQDEHERWHKRVLWGRESVEEFAASLFRLACECGYQEAQTKVFAADGGGMVLDHSPALLRRRHRHSGLVSCRRTCVDRRSRSPSG